MLIKFTIKPTTATAARMPMMTTTESDARHGDGRSDLTSAGANYALYGVPHSAARPVGEWNAARVVARGDTVEHWLNGTKLLEYVAGSAEWQRLVAGSKFNEWKHYEAVLESFANANLCRRIEAYARPGMAKMLLKEGYRETRRIVLKDTFGGFH